MSIVLALWGAAFVVTASCWGTGAALVTSKQPLVALLCGWCVFLVLCTVPWIGGFSAEAVRPLFWIFYGAGAVVIVRKKLWREAGLAALGTGAVACVLCMRCYNYHPDDALAFGAHGTDMWGYVGVAEWLYTHSTRVLPDIGNSPMRFNWTWYVLHTRERPLIYEALACLGASTGISAVNAYMAWPVALMGGLAMAVAATPRIFGTRHRWLAVVPALVMVFHPLIVLHWMAGFAAGVVVGLLVALAFGALIAAEEEGPARTEAIALTLLMTVGCGGLYSPQFMLVGVGLAAVLLVVGGVRTLWNHGWRQTLALRPSVLSGATLVAAAVVMAATLKLSGDEFIRGGNFNFTPETWGQILGIFGLNSPYAGLFYAPMQPWDLHPTMNPVGLAAAALAVGLWVAVAWTLWREKRDLRVPVVVGVCLLALVRVGGDERAVLAKSMPIFGFALVVAIAAASTRLRPRWLGLAAMLLCSLPAMRSWGELREMIHDPYITTTEGNMRKLEDGHNWRIMAYLYFREDAEGFDWSKNPKMFVSLTCFLPQPVQQKLAQKYRVVLAPGN